MSGERIIREPKCEEITGLPKSTRYRMMKAGTFPPKIQLGPRSSGWRLSDIQKWIESRPEAA